MYRLPISFYSRLMRGEVPIVYAVITTPIGTRAYAEKEMGGLFAGVPGHLGDGTVQGDGTILGGIDIVSMLDKAGRVLSFGTLERTMQSKKDDVLVAFNQKQQQHISIDLDNADHYFSRLIPKEPFIGRPINIYVGYEDEPQTTHLSLFKGTITELSVMPVMTIEADER